MKRNIKGSWLRFGFLCLLILVPGTKGRAETSPVVPKSSEWMNQVLQFISSTGEVSNPSNWAIYASVATYFYYQHFLKASLKVSDAARSVMLTQLRETSMTLKDKQKFLGEMDALIADLKTNVSSSERILSELVEHLKKLNSFRHRGAKEPFFSIEDYFRAEAWLASKEGRRFLETQKGKKWREKYESLRVLSYQGVDEALKKVIDKANQILPDRGARMIEASAHNNDLPGTFQTYDPFNYSESKVPLSHLNSRVLRLRGECEGVLARLAAKEKDLAFKSNYVRYWTQFENLRPSIVHAVVTSAGVAGSLWLHRLYSHSSGSSGSTGNSESESDVPDSTNPSEDNS